MPSRREALRAGSLRRRFGDGGLAAVLMLGLAAAVLVLGLVGAVFSGTTAGPATTLTAGTLNGYVPTAVSASRTAATTCLVSWTPVASPPAGLTYDVTDGTGSTVATAVAGTSASVTVPASSVSPTVKARIGNWVSSAATTAAAPCKGFPDAPSGLTLTPSDGAVTATWTAPAGHGGTVASYTATISPAPASGSATCTATVPTTTCSWSALTNGQAYVVSVTATSDVGTGPAASATTWPYPSGVMSPANLRLWLDGADTATLFASSGCTGAAATTTVGCWKDKSAQANHAVQTTSSYRPALATAAGHSVPSLDGVDDRLSLNPSLLPNGSSPSTQFLVAALDDPAPVSSGFRVAVTWGSTSVSGARTHGKMAGSATMFADARFDGGAVGGTWLASPSLLTSEFTASQLRTAPFGSGTWTSQASTTSTGTAVAVVGTDVDLTNFWQGRVPEVVVVGTTVTDAERRRVEEYLARKWGSTITPQAPTAVNGAATTATSTSANVSWTAPVWDGGSAVTSYTATAVPTAGGSTVTCTATAPTTTCTLTGLAGGGAQYAVTVTATNTAGTGPASSSATVFSGVPSAASAKLWLAADDLDADGAQESSAEAGLVSGAVQTWKDKSGGALDVTAPSAAKRPAYAARTLNTYAVPTFDGSTVLTGSGSNPYGITGDRSLFVVARERTVDPTNTFVVDRSPEDNPLFSLLVCSGSWALQHRDDTGAGLSCVSAGSSPSANRVDVVGAQRSGTSDSARVSGSPGSTATLAGTVTQRAVTIGRHVSFTGTFDLDVAEVLLYDTYLSGSQRRAVEKYLADKWGGSLAPDVPTAVTATATGTSGQATVSWTAPTDIGGSALNLYTARTTTGGFSCTATPPATSCTLTGLTDGTTYTVYVEARNSTGTGDRSATTTVTTATVPGAPTGVAATSGDTTSSVSWTAPAATGGSAITGYTVTAVPGNGGLPNVTCSAAAGPCTLTGLVNGVTYTVTVTATNAVGTGPASSPATVIPYPSSVMTSGATALWLDGADPAKLLASSACTGAAATTTVGCWLDKSSSGNSFSQGTAASQPVLATVNGFGVPSFDGTNDRLVGSALLLPTGTATSTVFAVGRLTDPTPTTSNYRTLFDYGTESGGRARTLEKPTTSSAVAAETYGGMITDGTWGPSSAQVVAAQFATGVVSLWNSGRPAVTTSTAFNTGTTFATLGSENTSLFWMGQTPEVVVLSTAPSATARRAVEEYLARKWAATITPQAPTAVTATGGQNTQSTVSWTAPSWNGGSAVTSYTATSSPGGLTCTTASTSCTVTGLTNGTAYTFTVTATNAVGTGPASSASAAVTPYTVPGAPTGVTAATGDTTSAVSWTAPASTGGSAITSYTASAVPSDGTLPTRTCSAATSPCTVTGLTNGVTYTVSVTATNAAGAGAASSTTTVLPYPSGVLTSARLELWLDGADPSRMFAGSTCSGAVATTTVGCWLDRSPNATPVDQGTTSQRPALTTVGGRQVPGFDGTDDDMQADIGVLPQGTAVSTMFTVATMTDPGPAASGMRDVFAWGWVSTGEARGIFKQANSSAVMASSWNANVVTSGVWSSSPQLAAAEHASPYVTLWTAGRPAVVSASSAFNTSWVGASLAHANNSYHWYGAIPEVMILNATLTAAERRQVEEYLARKWAVTVTPSAPQSLSATPGTGTASLSWSAPAWNGGAAVTSYTATVSGGGSCVVTGTTAACTGVPAGSRTFTVTATNSVGAGPAVTTTATVG